MICARKLPVVQEGDLVLLHGGYHFLVSCYVQPGEVLINKFGAFKHDDIIGTPFGALVLNTRKTTSLVALRPNPELWSISLRHRTQIVFSMDASVIAFRLNLRPGSVVVETGTGSGSLSHHFMRSIQPNGKLHTFEFNQQRADVAREEFRRHGLLDDLVTVRHVDAYGEAGFGLEHEADAVFLDLPMPWRAIRNAKKALKPNGMICSFSPCVEQVQRTCASLTKEGFYDVTTIEALTRGFYVRDLAVDTAKQNQTASTKAKQRSAASRIRDDAGGSADNSGAASSAAPTASATGPSDDVEEPEKKIARRDNKKCLSSSSDETANTDTSAGGRACPEHPVQGSGPLRPELGFQHVAGKSIVTRPVAAIRGHTSFLTFATIRDPRA